MSALTTTVTTTFTRTTAVSSSSPPGILRRRTSSEGPERSQNREGRRPDESASNRLISIRSVVSSRSGYISAGLATLSVQLAATTEGDVTWADKELASLEVRLYNLEDLEAQAWDLTALVEGPAARRTRMERWQEWRSRQEARVRDIKEASWNIQRSRPPKEPNRHEDCRRSTGHVEKVRLPQFSGRHEEFAEFRRQFQELCLGERYTPVLELAQLRLKIPKDAVHALGGILDPRTAWARLEEMYGNKEISIMSALKSIRDFKSSKSAAHERLIDLIVTVQRSQTVLESLDARHELVGDRETLASIVQALPPDTQGKWYDREVPDGETTCQKGEFLLTWLEKHRQNAIRFRLDAIATRMRTASPGRARPATQQESTDQGLSSRSLHTMNTGPGGSERQGGKDAAPQPPGRSGEASGAAGGRVEVKNAQDAATVAARRRTNLEAKKMDKCPVCAQVHTYERTWTGVDPPSRQRWCPPT